MTRDANQIAREHARVQQSPTEGPFDPKKPSRGTLTILSGFGDTATLLAEMINVLVQFTNTGLIIAGYTDGTKQAFLPVPGWCILFEPNEPNDAGE